VSTPPSAANDDWTVRRILDWTIGHLKERGSETPRLDAEVLLAHAWNCKRIQLYTRFDEAVPANVRSTMRELVKRRANAEPVAYLVGLREFFSLEFEIEPGIFIPRPTTELLIVDGLAFLKGRESPRVLELCTGSGCIAVTLAHQAAHARVDSVDINPLAVKVAGRNAERHAVSERVRVLEGDLFAPVANEPPYDLVVTNPPYVRTGEIPNLSADIRNHEPLLALDAGADGLDVIRRIVPELSRCLAPGGLFLLELSPRQVPEVTELLQATGFFPRVTPLKDLDRKDRALRAERAP
jgi:release factor glutamine methyltransferase